MTDYDYNNFDSDYLCPHCGGLLYLDTATPQNDVCINENCQLWPSDMKSIVDATETEEPGIYREIQEIEKLLIDEIRKEFHDHDGMLDGFFATAACPYIQ